MFVPSPHGSRKFTQQLQSYFPPDTRVGDALSIRQGLALLLSVHTFSKEQVGSLANLSRWAFLLTFAGAGLRTNFRQMSKGL